MGSRTVIRTIASLEECVSWAQAEGNLGVALSDEQLRSIRELWEHGTCFSLIRVEKEMQHYTEVLLAAVPTHPGEFLMISRDVTTTYAELEALRDFFNNGNYSLRCVGLDGTIMRANQQELQLLGYPPEQYIGQNIQKFYVDITVAQGYFKRLQAGESLVDVEAAMYHRDGSIRWLRINSTVRYSKHGNFMHTRCFTMDVTERKKLQLALQRAQVEAEAANEAKDRFIAALSHELRTPLTPVLFSLSLLQEDTRLPSDLREQVMSMQRCTELEVRLVDDLLDLSAIRRGVLRYSMGTADVHELLRLARSSVFVGEAVQFKDCRLLLAASRHHVHADQARLQQVFRNILQNAIRFIGRNGVVTINTTDENEGYLTVHFTDNGSGIDAALLPRLFEPFTAGPTTQSGLGLGLCISKSIIDAHGGTISAHSSGSNRGTTISIRIPLLSCPPTTLTPPSPTQIGTTATVPAESEHVAMVSSSSGNSGATGSTSTNGDKSKLNVLVVEDNAACRAVFVRAVRHRLGHTVDEAVTLAEALTLWRNNSYDLIISDIGLPDGTGHEFLQEVRSHSKGKRQRAIACSGYGMEADIATSMRVGFQKHLTKPVSFKDLERAIAEVISSPPSS